jgi:hypothetical protein
MSTNTLIKVVAMIDARIDLYEKAYPNKAYPNDTFRQGAIAALKSLEGELQSFIDTDISSMESTTGE